MTYVTSVVTGQYNSGNNYPPPIDVNDSAIEFAGTPCKSKNKESRARVRIISYTGSLFLELTILKNPFKKRL